MTPPPVRAPARRAFLFKVALALLSVLACGAALLVAELAVRWSGRVRAPTPSERESLEHTARYLDRCRHLSLRGGALWLAGASDDVRPVPQIKRAGVRRIVVIGESSAGMLAAGLSGQYTCDRVEVLDCAQGGAALEHV